MTARAPWTRLCLRGLVVLLVDAAALLALDALLDGFDLECRGDRHRRVMG